MSRDLKQLLHDTAAEPTSPVDPRGIVEQARRRTWMTRAIVSIITALAVVGAALGAQQVLDTSQNPEIVDQPEQVQEPDGNVPPGWQTLHVGTATFAVPGEWSVQRIDGTDDPMPCLQQLATTEHRVYLADGLYTPPCPATTPGEGDQQGQVTVYTYPAEQMSPDNEQAITSGGERVEFSRATAWMDNREAYRTYLFKDLDAVLLVTHRWDPQLADRILNSVRPAPSQLTPAAGAQRLTDEQVKRAVKLAAEEPATSQILAQHDIGDVYVQAGPEDQLGDTSTWVAFMFPEPTEPNVDPYTELCAIGGQTDHWLGVVVRVDVDGGNAASSSPIWTTGADCASWSGLDQIGDVLPLPGEKTSPGTLEPVGILHAEVEGAGKTLWLSLNTCNSEKYNVEIVETSDEYVRLLATATEGSMNDCSALATIQLDEPLGDRTLIDATDGEPIETDS